MIGFKHTRLFREIADPGIHPLLMDLLCELAEEWPSSMILTSVARDEDEQNKVSPVPYPKSPHNTKPCRAADIRIWNISEPLLKDIVEDLNGLWVYDPRRPTKQCLILESDHLHVQVHPNTYRVGSRHA